MILFISDVKSHSIFPNRHESWVKIASHSVKTLPATDCSIFYKSIGTKIQLKFDSCKLLCILSLSMTKFLYDAIQFTHERLSVKGHPPTSQNHGRNKCWKGGGGGQVPLPRNIPLRCNEWIVSQTYTMAVSDDGGSHEEYGEASRQCRATEQVLGPRVLR